MAAERGLVGTLRRWASGVRTTPLHPQWVAFRFKHLAADRVAEIKEGDLLDVGCADGGLRGRLPSPVRYMGLDYPATAKALYGTRPDVFGDAQQMPFVAGSYDHVVVLDVLEHLPRLDQCLAESARVLRPGGKVLIHVPFAYPLHDRPFDFWRVTEHGLHALAERAGLKIDIIEPCGHAVETSGLLMNLALSQSLALAVKRFKPLILLGILLVPAIAAINVSCWILSRLLPAVTFLPVSYWAVLSRRGSVGDR